MSLPVEARGDVLVDVVVLWVGALEVVDLAAKVTALVLAGDSSVEEDLFRCRGVGGVSGVEELLDVACMVEVLATESGDCAQLALGMPSAEGLSTDAILADDHCRCEVLRVPYCCRWQ